MGAERRNHERYPRRTLIKVRDAAYKAIESIAILHDVSQGGLFMSVAAVFDVGTLLSVDLPKSKLGPARHVTGRVMWSRPSSESTGWSEVGLRFGA